eukprot:734712-Rhodomonas_salina.1
MLACRVLRLCYAMSGTELGYGATASRTSTKLDYGATAGPDQYDDRQKHPNGIGIPVCMAFPEAPTHHCVRSYAHVWYLSTIHPPGLPGAGLGVWCYQAWAVLAAEGVSVSWYLLPYAPTRSISTDVVSPTPCSYALDQARGSVWCYRMLDINLAYDAMVWCYGVCITKLCYGATQRAVHSTEL